MKAWLQKESTAGIALFFGGAFFVIVLAGLLGFLLVQDLSRSGKFPPGSKVCGVNVTGLSKADAVKKCETELAEVAQKPVVLTLDEEKYTATPEELGLHLDYAKMVENAYGQAWSPNILERMFRSFVDRPAQVDGLLVVENNDELVSQFVKSVTDQVNKPPTNAYVDVTSGAAVIVKARDGYEVSEEEIRKEVGAAVNSQERTEAIVAKRTPAEIKDDVFNKLIVINLAEHNLNLYEREKGVAQFGIACGMSSWPTPVGQWKIVSKQMNPTWYNPHSAWSSSMPETIGPGYSNPLGLRAMALNASGVLIHGTSNSGSIGTSASHGCIRMHMNDVIALFDMVEVNTPVYIIRSAGNPGFDVTKTPSWRLEGATTPTPTYTGD